MGPGRLGSAGSADGILLTVSDGKLVEGQVIELEDGTTAYIQQVTVEKGEDHKFTSCFLEGCCKCNCNCLYSNSGAPLLARALRSPYRCRVFCPLPVVLRLNEQGHRTCDFLQSNKAKLLVV